MGYVTVYLQPLPHYPSFITSPRGHLVIVTCLTLGRWFPVLCPPVLRGSRLTSKIALLGKAEDCSPFLHQSRAFPMNKDLQENPGVFPTQQREEWKLSQAYWMAPLL